MKTLLLGGVSAVILTAAPHAGWSLTPQETWDLWKAQAEAFGMTLSAASETDAGATLTLEDVTYVGEWGFVRVEYRSGTLSLSEAGDAVEVALPESASVSFEATPPDEESFEAAGTISYPGASLTVSMDGDRLVEVGKLPTVEFVLDSAAVDGEPLDVSAKYTMAGADFTRGFTTAGNPVLDSEFAADGFAGGYTLNLPDEGVAMKNTVDIGGLTSSGTLELGSLLMELKGDLAGMDEKATAEMIGRVLDSGFRLTATSHYATNESTSESTDETGDFRSRFTVSDGTAEVSASRDGFAYAASAGAFDAALTMPGVPLPEIVFAGSGGESALSFPFASDGGTAPYALRFAVKGLTLGEPIWSIFDPSAVLPRDPATLVVALSGELRWLADLFSAEAIAGEAPPVEPVSANIDELRLEMLGANLTGTGGFTFDNSDKTTFPGVPRPEGAAELRLVGGNAVLDKLVQMGMVPQDQVMMVRMMIGMVAKPGPGTDELLSEIAISPDGQILINGAPMPF